MNTPERASEQANQPLASLAEALDVLHRDRGRISYQKTTHLLNKEISKTTVFEVIKCKGLPKWENLERVVRALSGDVEHFHELWKAADDAVRQKNRATAAVGSENGPAESPPPEKREPPDPAEIPPGVTSVPNQPPTATAAERPTRRQLLLLVSTATAVTVATAVAVPIILNRPETEPEPPKMPAPAGPTGVAGPNRRSGVSMINGRNLGDAGTPLWGVAIGSVAETAVAVVGCKDGSLRTWNLAGGEPGGKPLGAPGSRHRSDVYGVAVGDLDGRPVAASAGLDGGVGVWDLGAGERRGEFLGGNGGAMNAVALATFGARTHLAAGGDDQRVQVWDLSPARPIVKGAFGHGARVLAVTFGILKKRPIVVSGGDDGLIRVWDLATGDPYRTLDGRGGAVSALWVGVLRARPIVVSGGDDGLIRVWDLGDRTTIPRVLGGADPAPNGPVNALAVGAVGGVPTVVSGSETGYVRVWSLDTGALRGESSHVQNVKGVALGVVDNRVTAISVGWQEDVWRWTLGRP